MPRDDAALREAVRRNLGHPSQRGHLHRPLAVGAASILVPSSTTPEPLVSVGAPPPPEDLSLGIPGRAFCLSLSIPLGTRRVTTSPLLSFQYVIRRVTFTGNASLADPFSWRLLISPDNDETATDTPTGTDIVRFNTVLVAAEDVGMHSNLSVDAVEIEPWARVTTTPTFLKLKAHNAAAADRFLSAFVDLDEIATPVL